MRFDVTALDRIITRDQHPRRFAGLTWKQTCNALGWYRPLPGADAVDRSDKGAIDALKETAPAFLPGTFDPNPCPVARIGNVRRLSLLVLDFDTVGPQAVAAALSRAGYAFLVTATFKHGLCVAGRRLTRCRAVLPLAAPFIVAPDDEPLTLATNPDTGAAAPVAAHGSDRRYAVEVWRAAYKLAAAELGGDAPDLAACDAKRAFYLPVLTPWLAEVGGPVTLVGEGRPFDLQPHVRATLDGIEADRAAAAERAAAGRARAETARGNSAAADLLAARLRKIADYRLANLANRGQGGRSTGAMGVARNLSEMTILCPGLFAEADAVDMAAGAAIRAGAAIGEAYKAARKGWALGIEAGRPFELNDRERPPLPRRSPVPPFDPDAYMAGR